MAGRPVRSVLMDALQNLAQEDLNRFIQELWVREEEPRVPRRKVEGKDYINVANVMVSTLTERTAVNVAVEIMRRICCSDEADKLAEKAGGQTSQSASTDAEKAGGQTSQSASTDDKHFVDKHRVKLIEKVKNIDRILEDLLAEEVIDQEAYTRIRLIATPENKMRALYEGPLQAAEECKEIFYQILQKHEKFVIKGLKEKK